MKRLLECLTEGLFVLCPGFMKRFYASLKNGNEWDIHFSIVVGTLGTNEA